MIVSEEGFAAASTADPQNVDKLFGWISVLIDMAELTGAEDQKRILELIMEKCSSAFTHNLVEDKSAELCLYYWAKALNDFWEGASLKREIFFVTLVSLLLEKKIPLEKRTINLLKQLLKWVFIFGNFHLCLTNICGVGLVFICGMGISRNVFQYIKFASCSWSID